MNRLAFALCPAGRAEVGTVPRAMTRFADVVCCVGSRARLPSALFPRCFSSSLCDRTMLRRPSKSPGTPREEGCSSTAIGHVRHGHAAVWINPAVRGSAAWPCRRTWPAVP